MSSTLFADVDEGEQIFDESQHKSPVAEAVTHNDEDQPTSPFSKSLHAPLLKADEGDFMESIQSSLSDHSRECLRSESKNEGEGLGDDIPSKAEEKKGEGTSDGNASQESATRESFQEVHTESVQSEVQQERARKESISSNGSERAPVATPVPNSESPDLRGHVDNATLQSPPPVEEHAESIPSALSSVEGNENKVEHSSEENEEKHKLEQENKSLLEEVAKMKVKIMELEVAIKHRDDEIAELKKQIKPDSGAKKPIKSASDA